MKDLETNTTVEMLKQLDLLHLEKGILIQLSKSGLPRKTGDDVCHS